MKTIMITVEGMGEFPYDMLRYDGCYPRTEADSAELSRHSTRRRIVQLIAERQPGEPLATPERWESFNWRVIGTEEVL